MLAEATAIVASILLAFAIDAWWDERGVDTRRALLHEGLAADFSASQAHLIEWQDGVERQHAYRAGLLDAMRGVAIGEELAVTKRTLVGVLSAPTFSPTDSTLQAALAAGGLNLIEDDVLVTKLSSWRQFLADTSEDELLVRHLVVNQFVPSLSAQVRLGDVFDFDTQLDQFLDKRPYAGDEQVTLTVTSELEAQLAQLHFYATFIVNGYKDIYRVQAEIIELLEAR
jgi:hypothetical protein